MPRKQSPTLHARAIDHSNMPAPQVNVVKSNEDQCETCRHLTFAFELMLEYHAVARARYEQAVERGDVKEASALEAELASSSDPIRRAAKELREHEGTHSKEVAKTRHRLLRLVKSAQPKYGTSYLLDHLPTT